MKGERPSIIWLDEPVQQYGSVNWTLKPKGEPPMNVKDIGKVFATNKEVEETFTNKGDQIKKEGKTKIAPAHWDWATDVVAKVQAFEITKEDLLKATAKARGKPKPYSSSYYDHWKRAVTTFTRESLEDPTKAEEFVDTFNGHGARNAKIKARAKTKGTSPPLLDANLAKIKYHTLKGIRYIDRNSLIADKETGKVLWRSSIITALQEVGINVQADPNHPF